MAKTSKAAKPTPAKPERPGKATWSVNLKQATESVDADGTLHASLPLLDSGTKVADIDVTITADRVFEMVFTAVQGLGPDKTIVGFKTWSNV